VAVVAALVGIVLALAFTGWRGYTAQQRLRYGTAQVATDLRQAQERAKAERVVYTVTFVASSPNYTVARSGGGFLEHATLPEGVTAAASVTVTFSAFGRPDAAHTITVQSSAGTGVVTVTERGGISSQ
jgi:type II secretory pathway pseudopilin PulG